MLKPGEYYLQVSITTTIAVAHGKLECVVGPFATKATCKAWEATFHTDSVTEHMDLLKTEVLYPGETPFIEGLMLAPTSYAEVVERMIDSYVEAVQETMKILMLPNRHRACKQDAEYTHSS
jgi:hypothetical protein